MKRATGLSEASTFLHECVCLRTRHILVDGQSKGLPKWLMVKNPPASVGAAGNEGLIPGSGRSPGEGNGNPLQYSCQENPTDMVDPGGWQSMGSQRVRHDEQVSIHTEKVQSSMTGCFSAQAPACMYSAVITYGTFCESQDRVFLLTQQLIRHNCHPL